MRIALSFDRNLLSEYDRRRRPLVFGIAWEHNGTYYPDKDWIDFGVVILGWWFRVAAQLSGENISDDLCFMDGPYSINATYIREDVIELRPKGLDVSWQIPLGKFRKELIRAANEIRGELAQMGIGKESQISLEKYVRILQSVESSA